MSLTTSIKTVLHLSFLQKSLCFPHAEISQSFVKASQKKHCQAERTTRGVLQRCLRPATLLKKRLRHRCFPVYFATFLRTPFLQNTSGRLLLARSNFLDAYHFIDPNFEHVVYCYLNLYFDMSLCFPDVPFLILSFIVGKWCVIFLRVSLVTSLKSFKHFLVVFSFQLDIQSKSVEGVCHKK